MDITRRSRCIVLKDYQPNFLITNDVKPFAIDILIPAGAECSIIDIHPEHPDLAIVHLSGGDIDFNVLAVLTKSLRGVVCIPIDHLGVIATKDIFEELMANGTTFKDAFQKFGIVCPFEISCRPFTVPNAIALMQDERTAFPTRMAINELLKALGFDSSGRPINTAPNSDEDATDVRMPW